VESIKRAEYHLCSRLGLKPGMRVLDLGCGVGGPMRNMAIFSGAKIDGVSINEYQVGRGGGREGGREGGRTKIALCTQLTHPPSLPPSLPLR
jgi:SAM-dependent methyltransferase